MQYKPETCREEGRWEQIQGTGREDKVKQTDTELLWPSWVHIHPEAKKRWKKNLDETMQCFGYKKRCEAYLMCGTFRMSLLTCEVSGLKISPLSRMFWLTTNSRHRRDRNLTKKVGHPKVQVETTEA